MARASPQVCIGAVSGPVDFITDSQRCAHVSGGSAIRSKITALGGALTALFGAYAAVAPSFEATVAAFLHFAEAGERAGTAAHGPGSFSVAFLDALHALQPGDLNEARVSWN